MTSYIYLNTNDSLNRDTPADCTFNLNLPFSDTITTHISLDSIIFPNAVLPINANNNTIIFREDSDEKVDYTATITPGVYTGAALATEIKTRMDAATGNAYTYTITFSTLTKKLTFAATSFKILQSSTAKKVIGLGVNQSVFAASTTMSNPIRAAGTDYVHVISNFTGNSLSSGFNKRIFARVPIDKGYGELINYVSYKDDAESMDLSQLSTLHLRLEDDENRLYDLSSNCPVSYVIKLHIIN